jgi:hypothetical protein
MPQIVRCSYPDVVLRTLGLNDGQFHCNRCNIQLCGDETLSPFVSLDAALDGLRYLDKRVEARVVIPP